jgi:hypothetical protein
VMFEPALVKLPIIEGAELWRQAAQCPDQPELRGGPRPLSDADPSERRLFGGIRGTPPRRGRSDLKS